VYLVLIIKVTISVQNYTCISIQMYLKLEIACDVLRFQDDEEDSHSETDGVGDISAGGAAVDISPGGVPINLHTLHRLCSPKDESVSPIAASMYRGDHSLGNRRGGHAPTAAAATKTVCYETVGYERASNRVAGEHLVPDVMSERAISDIMSECVSSNMMSEHVISGERSSGGGVLDVSRLVMQSIDAITPSSCGNSCGWR
jgi:hypothetical protein